MQLFYWLIAAVLVVVQLLIIASSFRAQREQEASLSFRKRVTELFWTVVPALVLVVLLALTWRAITPPS